jgi:UBX domain-containing protein 1
MVDPKKEKQRQYTGGASSGMMVEDTPDDDEEESEGDNMPMDEKSIVDQILAKAKKASEEAIRENEEQRANQQKKKYFTGAGRKLGAEDNAAVPESSSNTGSQPQSPELENVERHMTFWRNGFTIEDGPLLRYDDPANQTLLNAIQSGRAPMELFKVKYGQRAEVKVSQRRDEDYVPPPKKIVAFEGEGRRLGSHVPSYTAPPSVSSSAQPRPNLVIDENAPTTSIQIRLADGTR